MIAYSYRWFCVKGAKQGEKGQYRQLVKKDKKYLSTYRDFATPLYALYALYANKKLEKKEKKSFQDKNPENRGENTNITNLNNYAYIILLKVFEEFFLVSDFFNEDSFSDEKKFFNLSSKEFFSTFRYTRIETSKSLSPDSDKVSLNFCLKSSGLIPKIR